MEASIKAARELMSIRDGKPAFALPFKLLSPVLKVSFGRMASDGQRYFAKQV